MAKKPVPVEDRVIDKPSDEGKAPAPAVLGEVDPFAPNTPEQEALLRSAGAGSLSDYAKMTYLQGQPFPLSVNDCTDTGAGFVQDAFRARRAGAAGPTPPVPPGPLFTTQALAIQNTNQPAVQVPPLDALQFTPNSTVSFAGTGVPALDAAGATFVVVNVATTYPTFRIDTDLSALSLPVKKPGMTVSLISAGLRRAPKHDKDGRLVPPPALEDQQVELLANAGAGSLSDYAKQARAAGEPFLLSREEAACHGSGSMQDGLKTVVEEEYRAHERTTPQ